MRCRMYGFDADSAEQGLPLPAMDSSGVRNRHNPVAATENVELAQHSPTSTAGTLTPSSDGNLTDIQGKRKQFSDILGRENNSHVLF